MKLRELVGAYNRLDKAVVSKLDEKDAIKILKARKAMRPHADEYDAFLKDCQEKLKPENWDDIQGKLQQWQQEGENTKLTEAERIEVNKAWITYESAIQRAVKEELEKEIEVSFEKLSEGCDVKLMQENKWTVHQLEELNILF